MSTKDTLAELTAKTKLLEIERELQELKQSDESSDAVKQHEILIQLLQKENELAEQQFRIKTLSGEIGTEQREAEEKTLLESIKNRNSSINQQKIVLKQLKEEQDRNKDLLKLYGGLVEVEKKRKVESGGFFKELKNIYDISKNITQEQAKATFAAKFQEMGVAAAFAAKSIIQANLALDDIFASARRATFTTGELDQSIVDITKSNVSAAITYEKSAQAIVGLRESMVDMSGMSEEAKNKLGGFAAQMDKLGFSVNTTGKFINLATKGMAMSRDQAMSYQKELVVFAKTNGISAKMIQEGLDSTMPRLAAFGKDAPKIFKEVAFQAHNMGMAMGEVLDITEKFTTFEGAATFVGQFNAAMGRNALDTIDVLRKASDSPADLIQDIRNQLQMSGQTFEQMSNQRKRFIADITGISLPQLSAMMKKTSAEMKEATRVEEEYNKILEASTSLSEKFKALMTALTPIMMPLIQTVSSIVTELTKFAQEYSGLVKVVGSAILALGLFNIVVGSVNTIAKITAVNLGFLKAIFTKKAAATAADTLATEANMAASELNTAAKGTETLATEGSTVAKNLDTASTAANSEAKLAAAAATRAAAAAQTAAAAATRAAGAAGATATPGIVSFGIGMLLAGVGALALGAGIALALGSAALLIDVLVKAGDAAITATVSFFGIAIAIGVLAFALAELGVVGALGAGVLLAVAAAAAVIAVAYTAANKSMEQTALAIKSLETIDTTKFDKLREIMKEMAGYMETIGNGAKQLNAVPYVQPIRVKAESASIAAKTPVVGATTEGGGTSEKIIKVEINSPIKIDGLTLARWVHSQYSGWESGKSVVEALNGTGAPFGAGAAPK